MATVERPGPNHTIVHVGIGMESECKVEVHSSLKPAEGLAIEGEKPYMDEEVYMYGKDDSIETVPRRRIILDEV